MYPKFRVNLSAQQRNNEHGAVLLIGLVLILFFLTTAALVLDIARIERVTLSLQQAADASSLAGAAVLRPTANGVTESAEVLGWRAAKVAIFRVLESNQIFADTHEINGGPSAASSCSFLPSPSLYFDDESWRCVELEYPNLTARIERGIYYKDASNTLLFASMEEVNDCCEVSPCREHVPYCSGAGAPSPRPDVSNGVRVRLTLKKISTTFAGLISNGSVRDIAREAVASQQPYP